MEPNDEDIEALLATTQVGDTVRVLLPKVQVLAVARDRVSPVLERPSTPDGPGLVLSTSPPWDGIWTPTAHHVPATSAA